VFGFVGLFGLIDFCFYISHVLLWLIWFFTLVGPVVLRVLLYVVILLLELWVVLVFLDFGLLEKPTSPNNQSNYIKIETYEINVVWCVDWCVRLGSLVWLVLFLPLFWLVQLVWLILLQALHHDVELVLWNSCLKPKQ
jgi:hypothetical protein